MYTLYQYYIQGIANDEDEGNLLRPIFVDARGFGWLCRALWRRARDLRRRTLEGEYRLQK